MTKDEVQWQLDDAIQMVTGKAGPHQTETRIAALCQDSLETLELLITLEQKFDRSFDTASDSDIHAGTYGDLLFYLGSVVGTHVGSYGDMGVPGDNHWDHSKRGFQPK